MNRHLRFTPLRVAVLLCLIAMLGISCMYQRQRIDGPTQPHANAAASPQDAPIVVTKPQQASQPDAQTQLRTDALTSAVAAVHRYLGALASGDDKTADSAWQTGTVTPHHGDQILREIADLASMRIETGAPRPLDSARPSQHIEVPVQLRVGSSQGLQRYQGWYRLRKAVQGEHWEITSASVQRLSP